MTFELAVSAEVLRFSRPGTRWLSTGWNGGFRRADVAYNVTVPEGFDRTDLDRYVAERRDEAGFAAAESAGSDRSADASGPALLTGVEMRHARVAGAGPVTVAATAGVSNPAALPVDAARSSQAESGGGSASPVRAGGESDGPADSPGRGTVNLLVGTTRRLDDAGLATLLGVAVEAKTATLLPRTGFPGTTTDAVVVGSARDGDPAAFAGSATAVGDAARACVRDALLASLDSRYGEGEASIPASVADAEHGVVTDRETEVRRP
jgi:adenosylcobinamide hydrolase